MKRAGGRRYYRPDDVDLLRGIHHLLYGEGYTIRGVQRILRDQGLKFVQSVWQPDAEQPPHGRSTMTTKQPDNAELQLAGGAVAAAPRPAADAGLRIRAHDVARGFAKASGSVVRTRRMPPPARQRDRSPERSDVRRTPEQARTLASGAASPERAHPVMPYGGQARSLAAPDVQSRQAPEVHEGHGDVHRIRPFEPAQDALASVVPCRLSGNNNWRRGRRRGGG